jgi:hypothetical protein
MGSVTGSIDAAAAAAAAYCNIWEKKLNMMS